MKLQYTVGRMRSAHKQRMGEESLNSAVDEMDSKPDTRALCEQNGEIVMVSLKQKLPLRKNAFMRLDQVYALEKANKAQICPSCRRAGLRIATMETMSRSDEGLRIGFFTCMSCNVNWSYPMK
jgi:hypothetical protein